MTAGRLYYLLIFIYLCKYTVNKPNKHDMKKRFLCLVAFLLGAIGASAQTAAQVSKLIEWEKWLDENNITMTYNFKYNKLKYIIHFNLSKQ